MHMRGYRIWPDLHVVRVLMETIKDIYSFVSKRVKEDRKTHKSLSEELNALYPGKGGLSVRSVRRFCEKHDIHVRPTLNALTIEDLDRVVASSVAKVSHHIVY